MALEGFGSRYVWRQVWVLGVAIALMTGCEKKTPVAAPAPAGGAPAATPPAGGAPAAPAAASAGGGAAYDASQHTGSIVGTITVDGNIPAPAPVDMKSKPECAMLHGANPPVADQLVVGAGKGLKDCFVYIKSGLESFKFSPPAEPVVIDQKGCMYHPHVFGVQVGQDIKILNSDPFAHNVNVKDNNPFNNAMAKDQAPEIKKAWFKKEQVPTSFACDIHAWMAAKACVVKHPLWAVTDADGKFTIKGVPAGKYKVAIWHESVPGLSLAQKEYDLEVKAGEAKTQDAKFTYSN